MCVLFPYGILHITSWSLGSVTTVWKKSRKPNMMMPERNYNKKVRIRDGYLGRDSNGDSWRFTRDKSVRYCFLTSFFPSYRYYSYKTKDEVDIAIIMYGCCT